MARNPLRPTQRSNSPRTQRPMSPYKPANEYCTPGESHQFNPTCGDEATIHVEVSDDEPHTIKRLVWDGHGCSISQASLSVMVDLVDGKTVDEAMDLEQTFHKLMESRGAGLDDENLEEKLGDAVVFQGVSKYPMRIKCALGLGRAEGLHRQSPRCKELEGNMSNDNLVPEPQPSVFDAVNGVLQDEGGRSAA